MYQRRITKSRHVTGNARPAAYLTCRIEPKKSFSSVANVIVGSIVACLRMNDFPDEPAFVVVYARLL